jgi:hypothetical protein
MQKPKKEPSMCLAVQSHEKQGNLVNSLANMVHQQIVYMIKSSRQGQRKT